MGCVLPSYEGLWNFPLKLSATFFQSQYPRYWEAKDLADVIMYQSKSSSSEPPWYDGPSGNSTVTNAMGTSQRKLQRSGAASLEHPPNQTSNVLDGHPILSSNPDGVATVCHPSVQHVSVLSYGQCAIFMIRCSLISRCIKSGITII